MKKWFLLLFLSLFLELFIISMAVFLYPKAYIYGFFPDGLFSIPIISILLSVAILLLLRSFCKVKASLTLAFSLILCIVFLCTIFFISILPYLNNLDYMRENYKYSKLYKEKGRIDYPSFTYSTKDHPIPFDVENQTKTINKIYKSVPITWTLSYIQKDEVANIYWFEILKPSLLYGALSYYGFYNVSRDSISNLIESSVIWNSGLKKNSDFVGEKREHVINYLFLQEIQHKDSNITVDLDNNRFYIITFK